MFLGTDPLFEDWNASVTISPLVLSSGSAHATGSGDSIDYGWLSQSKEIASDSTGYLSAYPVHNPSLGIGSPHISLPLTRRISTPKQASQVPLSPLPFISRAFDDSPFEESLGLTRTWYGLGTDISPIVHASSATGSGLFDRLPVNVLSHNMSFVDKLQRVRALRRSDDESETSTLVNEGHSNGPILSLGSPIKTPSGKQPMSIVTCATLSIANTANVTPKSSSATSPLSPLTPLTPLTPPQRGRKRDFPISPCMLTQKRKAATDLRPPCPLPQKRLRSSRQNLNHALVRDDRRSEASLRQTRTLQPLSTNKITPVKPAGHSDQPQYTLRHLPQQDGKSRIEISPDFPLLYRRFPASSYFQPAEFTSPFNLFQVTNPGGEYNPPRSAFDLYTPRFVKGKGSAKVGLCPICVEPLNRGGEDKKLWLHMKFSAFKCYHMQCAHGISASTGQPFSPPIAFRTVKRANAGKNERTVLKEGKCHKCLKWVAVEGIKDLESKVKELYWWKHAVSCHQGSTFIDKEDVFENDEVYERLSTLQK